MGVTMPSEFSSPGSVDDSRALARNLGIELRQVAIADVYHAYLATLEPRVRGTEAGHDRGEHPGPRPRQHPDGALQQVRPAGADDRQQERTGGRLLHALRRHERRALRAGRRAQDDGLRARRATSIATEEVIPRPPSPSRRRPSCGPTRPTRTRCRPTTCSTRSSTATWRTGCRSRRSSRPGFDRRDGRVGDQGSRTATSTSGARLRRAQGDEQGLRYGLADADRRPVLTAAQSEEDSPHRLQIGPQSIGASGQLQGRAVSPCWASIIDWLYRAGTNVESSFSACV